MKDLIWQIEAGIDECIGDTPLNCYEVLLTGASDHSSSRYEQIADDYSELESRTLESVSPVSAALKPNINHTLLELNGSNGSDVEHAILSAAAISEATNSIMDLKTAVTNFNECKLHKTAINTVFADGDGSSNVMLIGDVPGATEDRNGIPFSGQSGQLLDKMLASINLDRSSCYITNLVFWRPPGDRAPTPDEIAVCIPFVKRHIELVSPKILILLGGTVSKVLLGMKQGITKIHGQWFEYSTSKMAAPVPAIPFYHPVNLLGSPAYKHEAWRDLLRIKARLANKK